VSRTIELPFQAGFRPNFFVPVKSIAKPESGKIMLLISQLTNIFALLLKNKEAAIISWP
jgi:hypothetical protein